MIEMSLPLLQISLGYDFGFSLILLE